MSKINQERTNIQKGCGKNGDTPEDAIWKLMRNKYDYEALQSYVNKKIKEARLSQHDKTMKLVKEEIDKNCYSYDGELEDGNPKMHRIIWGSREDSWIPYGKLMEKFK